MAADDVTEQYAAAMDEAIAAAATAEARVAELQARVAQLEARVARSYYHGDEEIRRMPDEDGEPLYGYTVSAFYKGEYPVPDGRSITEAHSYWFKWDRLYIVWEEGEQPVEIEGHNAECPEFFKRPLNLRDESPA